MIQVTTSWDDGSPFDFRLAELLEKHQLRGTFYIPRQNVENKVMDENSIAELAKKFEIGGHTLTHRSLGNASSREINDEVRGCYAWLTGLLHKNPTSFCLPFGHFSAEAVKIIQETGFRYIRTTELLSTQCPQQLSHTTLQIYPHSKLTYLKHLLKRGRIQNLKVWIRSGPVDDLFQLVDYYLEYVKIHGGCLHLWGHSWEIEANGLWITLEEIFRRIADKPDCSYVENGQLVMTPNPK